MITHDMELAYAYADRIIVLRDAAPPMTARPPRYGRSMRSWRRTASSCRRSAARLPASWLNLS